MMALYRSGNRILNMALLIDARYDGTKERLALAFSAPQPASVGQHDWTCEAYEVVLKGDAAADCWEWICRQSVVGD